MKRTLLAIASPLIAAFWLVALNVAFFGMLGIGGFLLLAWIGAAP